MSTRYTPEPMNSFTNLRAIAKQEVMAALASQSSMSAVTPRSIPQDAVVTPFVTNLPVAASDGDEIRYLASDANGVVWHLRYRANAPSDYQWEFIGGSELYNEVLTTQSTSSTSYASLSGPAITVPLSGEYFVTIGALMYQTTGGIGRMSYDVGSTGALDADAIAEEQTTGVYMTRTGHNTITAGSAFTAKYKTTSNTLNTENRWMSVKPIRVGRQ